MRRITSLMAALGIATAGLVGLGAPAADAAIPAITAKTCSAEGGLYTQTKTTRVCTVFDGVEGSTGLISNTSAVEDDGDTQTWYYTGNYRRIEEFARTTVTTQNIKTGVISRTTSLQFVRVVRFENVTCTKTESGVFGTNVTEVDIHECDIRGLYV